MHSGRHLLSGANCKAALFVSGVSARQSASVTDCRSVIDSLHIHQLSIGGEAAAFAAPQSVHNLTGMFCGCLDVCTIKIDYCPLNWPPMMPMMCNCVYIVLLSCHARHYLFVVAIAHGYYRLKLDWSFEATLWLHSITCLSTFRWVQAHRYAQEWSVATKSVRLHVACVGRTQSVHCHYMKALTTGHRAALVAHPQRCRH